MAQSYDVVVAGGAVTGSSVACHLAMDPAFRGRVLVVEKDPTYTKCASALSAASIRQQYSSAINVQISLYGIEFLRDIGARLQVDGDRPDIGLHEGGYLFIATEAGRAVLEENHAVQTRYGADIRLMDPAGLSRRFPWLAVDDLVLGAFGASGEGWFDGYGLMQAFRRKARSLGVDYRAGAVTDVVREGDRIVAVRLDDGSEIACGALVNAAGAGGPALAKAAGLEIPVHNKKRMIFTFRCAEPVLGCPLLVDTTGVYVRPEGESFLCGVVPPEERDPDASEDFEVEWDIFDEIIWPALASRIPAFERIRPGRAWAGHYDMSAYDHNAFVGRAPGYANFYLANGFSGHGLQQSPAIGRGLAEVIVHGGYRTLDLTPMNFARIALNEPILEKNVV